MVQKLVSVNLHGELCCLFSFIVNESLHKPYIWMSSLVISGINKKLNRWLNSKARHCKKLASSITDHVHALESFLIIVENIQIDLEDVSIYSHR